MKKILTATCIISLAFATSAYAADTYLGGLIETQQKKIDAAVSPAINKEREIRQKQADMQTVSQKQAADRQNQIQAQQKAQQELINKKQQQIQAQKDAIKKQKDDLKNLFTIQ